MTVSVATFDDQESSKAECKRELDEITAVESTQVSNSKNIAIYKAVQTCDTSGFLLATQGIDAGSLMKQVTHHGNTVLHVAVISGCDDLVVRILRLWPDLLMSKNNDGDNPLQIAIKNGHKEAAKFLAEEYPSKENEGEIAIKDPALRRRIKLVVRAAIAAQNREIIDGILRKDSTLLNLKDGNSAALLYLAAPNCNWHSKVVRALLRWLRTWGPISHSDRSNSYPDVSTLLPNNALPSAWNSDVVKSMHRDTYMALKTCDIQGFLLVARYINDINLLNQVTPQGNTVLHLAAGNGCDALVDLILERWPNLLILKNSMGNLAHHVAANEGHFSTLQILVSYSPASLDFLENGKNNDGDNPLHIAIKNRHQAATMLLVEKYPKSACSLNKEYKSPLYMAAKLGCLEFIKAVIEKHQVEIVTNDPDLRPKIKSVVHAAIDGESIEILRTILRKDSTLIHLKDEKRTALSYAAFKGYHEGVDYLLDNYPQTVYEADENGLFPIHTASAKGHITIIKKILAKCPDAIECLNSKRQNIIHVAAMRGKYGVISYMLKEPLFEKLINQGDVDGNTPLHLATTNWHPKVVRALTWDKRVTSTLENSDGVTALDAAEEYMGPNLSCRKRLKWRGLRTAGARAPKAQRSSSIQIKAKNLNPSELPRLEKYKDRVNTLLLVATLVATVTFAAGFTIPGGYNDSSGPWRGMATLHTKHMFHTFVICDTIAMYSSIIAVVTLIWAQLDDLHLILTVLRLAMPLLGIALTSMSIAFMAGVYLVISDVAWLATTVLILGSIFLVTFMLLFIPLYLPNSSPYPAIRYLVYYLPFYPLVLATDTDTDDDANE